MTITPLDCCAAMSPVAVEELRQLRDRIQQLEQGGVMSSFDEWWKEYDHHGRSLKYSVASDAWNAALDAAAKVIDEDVDWDCFCEGDGITSPEIICGPCELVSRIAAAIERLKEE